MNVYLSVYIYIYSFSYIFKEIYARIHFNNNTVFYTSIYIYIYIPPNVLRLFHTLTVTKKESSFVFLSFCLSPRVFPSFQEVCVSGSGSSPISSWIIRRELVEKLRGERSRDQLRERERVMRERIRGGREIPGSTERERERGGETSVVDVTHRYRYTIAYEYYIDSTTHTHTRIVSQLNSHPETRSKSCPDFPFARCG